MTFQLVAEGGKLIESNIRITHRLTSARSFYATKNFLRFLMYGVLQCVRSSPVCLGGIGCKSLMGGPKVVIVPVWDAQQLLARVGSCSSTRKNMKRRFGMAPVTNQWSIQMAPATPEVSPLHEKGVCIIALADSASILFHQAQAHKIFFPGVPGLPPACHLALAAGLALGWGWAGLATGWAHRSTL